MTSTQQPRGLRRLAAAGAASGCSASGAAGTARRAGRAAGADHHRRRRPGRPAVRGAARAGRRRPGAGPGRRGAAGAGRAAAGPLAVRGLAADTPATGPASSPSTPRPSSCPACWPRWRCWTPRTGTAAGTGWCWTAAPATMTATLRVIPASPWLADRADADGWVANWGAWLASLGYLPAVRWVTVTVDTAPEPGTTLADAVAAALDPAAPLAARQIMASSPPPPRRPPPTSTRACRVTFDPAASPSAAPGPDRRRRRGRADAARPGISAGHLRGHRAGPGQRRRDRRHRPHRLRPRQPRRGQPAARPARRRGPAPGLGWAEAGPVGAEEAPDCYRHDSGISITWAGRRRPGRTSPPTCSPAWSPPAVPQAGHPCSTGRSRPPRRPGCWKPR